MKDALSRIFTALLLFAIPLAPAMAGEVMAGDIAIHQPWARALPANSVNGAVYLTVHNIGAGADRLVGASASNAALAQIHDHVTEDGLMKMVHLEDGAVIEPGGMLAFKPHGMHIMLMQLSESLDEGGMFELTLEFEKAGTVILMVPVTADGPALDHTTDHGADDAQ